MKTSIAIWLLVGVAIGGIMMGLIRSGANVLNISPVGRIVILIFALIIGLGALGAYFRSKKDNSY